VLDIARADPIFVHGIMPRSGTNFLWELLLLHPDCSRPRAPVREDLFLDHSDHLAAFIEAAHRAWDPAWGTFGPDVAEQFYSALGEGLVSFLWADRSRRLVTKSPSVQHLDRFFSFYPWARLIVLVRDGRSVVQSAMDTFGWDFDRACRAWSQAADTVRRFQEAERERAARWRLVRYEDLIDDTVGQMRALLDFLELDATRYDFEAACTQPVRGSSAFGRDGRAVHWNAVPRDASFTPKERWRSWSAEKLERFDWLAGDQLRALGYDTVPRVRSITGTVRHRWRDWQWTTARMARWTLYRTRVRVGIAFRPLRRRLGLVRET
jgi:protein-tyrosine sulfotransferase